VVVLLFGWRAAFGRRADQGVGRGPGGPPHIGLTMRGGWSLKLRFLGIPGKRLKIG
jgi:hypothetical protein